MRETFRNGTALYLDWGDGYKRRTKYTGICACTHTNTNKNQEI